MEKNSMGRSPVQSGKERILDVALRLFSREGFVRVTTDRIAQEAQVSQTYVVRAFGSKNGLILALCERARTHIENYFRTAVLLKDPESREEFRNQFDKLAFRSDEMRLLAQLFAAGNDSELGPSARKGFTRICHLLHVELGLSKKETREIIANGMLATTMAALDYERPADPIIEYLISR